MEQFSPPIQISKVQLTENIDVHIIREDLLPGGTKQRAVISFFNRPKNVKFYRSDLRFHEPEPDIPPVPSNKYYDAKLWSFIAQHAKHNDIWWNVAR